MSKFLTTLRLEQVDGHVWLVYEPLVYRLGAGAITFDIAVPPGFHTDLASIPRFFWRAAPSSGIHNPAAVLHDWLYTSGACSRVLADAVFLDALETLGLRWVRRHLLYYGVRLFGWVPWGRYRRELRKFEAQAVAEAASADGPRSQFMA